MSDTHQGIAAINPHLYAKVGYDPLTDFAPVARFGIGQQALVVPAASPITSVAKSGALRALAVSGARRVPAWPDVPTHAEAGVPGYEYIAWTASRRRRPPRGGWWSS